MVTRKMNNETEKKNAGNTTQSKKEFIKSWKSELDNLRNIWCQEGHKTQLNFLLENIDCLIEEIAETKKFTEE